MALQAAQYARRDNTVQLLLLIARSATLASLRSLGPLSAPHAVDNSAFSSLWVPIILPTVVDPIGLQIWISLLVSLALLARNPVLKKVCATHARVARLVRTEPYA